MRQQRSAGTAGLWWGCAAALALAGCGHKQRPAMIQPLPPASDRPAADASAPPAVPVATPDLTPARRLALAADLLDHGEVDRARAELNQLLRDDPTDRHAQTLLRSLDADPRQLYGADSYAHQLQGDENLVDVAREYMGDLYQFYGLARFNNIVVPSSVTAGQTIMIPGRPRPVESAPRRAPRAVPSGERPAAAPPQTAAPTVDRAKAQRLRRAGLESLSAGSADQAVSQLSQAASLDPDNAAIRADLARAQRIRSAVRR